MEAVRADTFQDKRDVFFVTPDDRTVAARVLGPEYGIPVLTLHGNPGSRVGPHVGAPGLDELGVRLIAPDRPGYGLSDRDKGRRIIDTAADMEGLMDWLGIKKFGILARSGGVPHALACAALLGERVFGVVSFAALAPKTANIEWEGGMTDDNKAKHKAATLSPKALAKIMRRHARSIRKDPYHILNMLYPDLELDDNIALLTTGPGERTRADLARSQQEGLRQGGAGWIDDTLALHKDWGFDVRSITTPVTLWHGLRDPFASPDHSRWLARKIPNATLMEDPEGSHLSSLFYARDALRSLWDLRLGPDADVRLKQLIAENEERIFKSTGVMPEQVPQPVWASDGDSTFIEFTEEYMAKRVAIARVRNSLPTLVKTVIMELEDGTSPAKDQDFMSTDTTQNY